VLQQTPQTARTPRGQLVGAQVGDGPPLLLLHATLHDRHDFDPIIPTRARNHRVLALAQVAGLSPFPFARAFKATTGWSPRQFVTACRVHRATVLLAASTMPVAEVAVGAGISNLSYFRWLFAGTWVSCPGNCEKTTRLDPVRQAGSCQHQTMAGTHLFINGDTPLAARVYRITDDIVERQPAVLVTGSWLTVKEQMADLYAGALAAQGFAAITFDFAGFGASGGAPRQARSPSGRSPTSPLWLSRCPGCRSSTPGKSATWRSAPAPSTRSPPSQARRSPHSRASAAGTMTPDRRPFCGGAGRRRWRNTSALGPCAPYPPPRAATSGRACSSRWNYYANRARGAVASWVNEMAEISWPFWLTFDGLAAAPEVDVPALFVHSDGCVLPGNVKKIRGQLAGPTELIWADGSQTDFYDQPQQVSAAADAAATHFRTTLRMP
jgi:AraC-like DNA-binding protein